MTYPLSDDVSGGQPTAAAHYNNLRADALRMGQAAADAVNIGEILLNFSDNLILSYLSPNKVRIQASSLSPVSLVIQGRPLIAIANVDLSTTISGAAAVWYLFANYAPGSTTFTLTANTSATPTAYQRLIGQCYWKGSALDPGSIVRYDRTSFLSAFGLTPPGSAGGRLSLTSGNPLPTADASGSTVYYVPFISNVISLYATAYGWINRQFSEISVSIPVVASTPYDVFAYWDGDSVALAAVAWASAAARASAVSLQNGFWVLTSDKSYRLLGTVATDASGTVQDTTLQRFVWNLHNQAARALIVSDTTDHVYNVSTWRFWNNDLNNHCDFVLGFDAPIQAVFYGDQASSAAGYPIRLAIALDDLSPDVILGQSGGGNFKGTTTLTVLVTPGIHSLNMIEYGHPSTTNNFYNGEIASLFLA